MKNFLRTITAFVLAYLVTILRSATLTAWMWLPMLMEHSAGLTIGFIISIVGEILYNKFFGDN